MALPPALPVIPVVEATVEGGRCSTDLPELPIVPVPKTQAVHRGGGGELNMQSQMILAALHKTFDGKVAEVSNLLGWNPGLKIAGFLARCTGLSRGCVEKRLGTLRSANWLPQARPKHAGRKRKNSEVSDRDVGAEAEAAVVAVAAADSSMSAPACAKSVHEIVESGHFWKEHAQERCPYGGLMSLTDQTAQQQMVGLRLSCVALRLNAMGCLHEFAEAVNLLDSFLPGEFGERQHSAHFAKGIVDETYKTLRIHLAWGLQQVLLPLKIPSDLALTTDGVTTSAGESLQIQMCYSFDRSGVSVMSLLDAASLSTAEITRAQSRPGAATPRSAAKANVVEFNEEMTLQQFLDQSSAAEPNAKARPKAKAKASLKKGRLIDLHTGPKLVQNLQSTLKKFGVGHQDLALRFAVHCGDGLIEGPFGCEAGKLLAQELGICGNGPSGPQSPSPSTRSDLSASFGSLDMFHACEKSGQHADMVEFNEANGYLKDLFWCAKQARRLYQLGQGRIILRATHLHFA